jgi:hypothetical protein
MENPIRNYFTQIDKFANEHQLDTFNSVIADDELQKRVTFQLWNYTTPPETENKVYTAPQILYYDNWSDDPDYKLTYYPDTDTLKVASR